MTGFKSGASDDDPLGGDSDSGGSLDVESTSTDTVDEASGQSTNSASGQASTSERQSDDAAGTTVTTTSEDQDSGLDGLPWIYQRNSITDGREKTVQLHLQQSTLDEQREAKADVEQRLGESVRKADLREAALLVGLQHVDETADRLREWGYDFE